MDAFEANFDGLVGPTHNYSGLAYGNVASAHFAGSASNPRAAALQGIEKMRFCLGLGLRQGFLPPRLRPCLAALRGLGYGGTDAAIIERIYKENPVLLAQIYSSSFMWAANAATITAATDGVDGKIHFTPANLISAFHRSLEAADTSLLLRRIFAAPEYFSHHAPLPAQVQFSDEGAANHTRLAETHGARGVSLFVYGRAASDGAGAGPQKYPARQTLEASCAVARQHGVGAAHAVYARQNPAAIDAGVFHNDVIAVGNGNVLLCHEMTFAERDRVMAELQQKCGNWLQVIEISARDLPIADAVKSYFFNSQLVTLPDGSMAVIAPGEAQENQAARTCFDRILQANDNPISAVHYVDVRESMQNGGGPACLRLRVPMTRGAWAAVNPVFIATKERLNALENWVRTHYRDRLQPADLADPALVVEAHTAQDALEIILKN